MKNIPFRNVNGDKKAISDQIIRTRGPDLEVLVPESRELEGGEESQQKEEREAAASALLFREASEGGEGPSR